MRALGSMCTVVSLADCMLPAPSLGFCPHFLQIWCMPTIAALSSTVTALQLHQCVNMFLLSIWGIFTNIVTRVVSLGKLKVYLNAETR